MIDLTWLKFLTLGTLFVCVWEFVRLSPLYLEYIREVVKLAAPVTLVFWGIMLGAQELEQ